MLFRSDAKLRNQMRLEIKKLQRRLKTAAIYVTHDQVEAMTLADRIVVLNQGRVEQIGTPGEVYSQPASTFVASFIGAPPMNLLPAELSDKGLHVGAHVVPHRSDHRGPVTLGIRPERAHVNGAEEGIQIEVGVVEELGPHRLIHGRLGEHELTVAQDAEHPAPTGRIGLSFREEDAHLFHPETGSRV